MPRKPAAFIAHFSLPLLLLLALAMPGVPQNQDPAVNTQRPRKVFPKEQEPEDVLRFDTDLVSVDVTAMDPEGRPVRNLKQEDFKVYSDGSNNRSPSFKSKNGKVNCDRSRSCSRSTFRAA